MTVRVVTDSSAVLPPDLIERYRIEVVPLTLNWDDGESVLDGVMTYQQFAERTESGGVPTTSAPSPGEYQEALERVLADADGAFLITPPEQLSATHGNAVLAAEAVGTSRVCVFDSRSAAGGQGLVVLAAARAGETVDLDAVRERAAFVASRVKVSATLERLDYLKRSGRVPGVAAMATGVLDIQPLFRIVDGTPSMAGMARGAQRATDKLFASWTETIPEAPARCHLVVFYSSRREAAEAMRARVVDRFGDTEAIIAEATAAIGAHIGPGMLGLAWWWEPGSVGGRG